jgi:hypothetical protein
MTDDQPAGCARCSNDVLAILHCRRLRLSWRGPDGLHHLETPPGWEAVSTRLETLSPGLGPLRAGLRHRPVDRTGLIGANGYLSRTWMLRGQTEVRRGRAKKAFAVKALVGAQLRVLDHRDVLVSAGVGEPIGWNRSEKVPRRSVPDHGGLLVCPSAAGRFYHGKRRLSATRTKGPVRHCRAALSPITSPPITPLVQTPLDPVAVVSRQLSVLRSHGYTSCLQLRPGCCTSFWNSPWKKGEQ